MRSLKHAVAKSTDLDAFDGDLITVFAPFPPQELFLGLGQTYASSVSGEPAVQQAATWVYADSQPWK